jgi:hypothetical protein
MGNNIRSEDWENQELEEMAVAYHRSLHQWGDPGSKASNSRNAYWLVGGSVKNGSAQTKDRQAFWKYATSWERAWSNLAFAGLPADPLVEGDSATVVGSRMVVGHVGWFREDVVWFAPNADAFGIGSVGRWDFEAFVARQNPRPGYYRLRNTVPPFDMSYLLVTDIGGGVLGGLAYRDADQIESSSVTPLDLLLVVELAVSLTGALAGKIVRTITSKFAKRAMSNGLRKLSAKEMASFRVLTSKELTYATSGKPGPFLADNSDVIGRGLADDGRLAQIYLNSPKVQEHFGILEKQLVVLESLDPRRPFNSPRVTGGLGGAVGNLSESASKFKTLPKLSATIEIQKHIEFVMKRAEVVDRTRLLWEAQVAYDVLVQEFRAPYKPTVPIGSGR